MMKFTIEAEELQKTSKRIAAVADSKSSIPILAHCLIDLGAGKIMASDLESSLALPFKNGAKGGGKLCIHAARLSHLAARLSGKLTIEETEGGAVIKAGGTKVRLNKMNPEKFPSLPSPAAGGFSLPLSALKTMIERTLFAVSRENSRYALEAALLEVEDGLARLVATDGHRLAIASMASEVGKQEPVLIPAAALRLISVFDGETIKISSAANHLFFETESCLLAQRATEGKFPNYRAVLPANHKTEAVVVAGALRQVLERALLVADARANAVTLALDPQAGKIVVSAQSSEAGEISDEVAAVITGPALTISFNAKYLLDFVKHAEGDIKFLATEADSAGEFRAGDEYRYVVMPVRI